MMFYVMAFAFSPLASRLSSDQLQLHAERTCSRGRPFFLVASPPSRDAAADALECVGEECESGWSAAPVGVPARTATVAPPPAGGKTIDLRRGRTGDAGTGPGEIRQYGQDPRSVPGDPEVEAEQVAVALADGPHASASNTDIIPLRSTDELKGALQKAGDEKLVVVKFYARWCKSGWK